MSAPLLFLFQSHPREINAPSYSLMPTMSFSQCSSVPAIPFMVSHHGGGARPFASLKKGVKHELLLCSCFQGDSSCSHSKNTTEDSLSYSRCSYYPMLSGSALLWCPVFSSREFKRKKQKLVMNFAKAGEQVKFFQENISRAGKYINRVFLSSHKEERSGEEWGWGGGGRNEVEGRGENRREWGKRISGVIYLVKITIKVIMQKCQTLATPTRHVTGAGWVADVQWNKFCSRACFSTKHAG